MIEKVAVVIPCYNEAEGIAKVIKKFPYKKLEKAGFQVTIYVVDNNSRDETANVARQAGAIVIEEKRKAKETLYALDSPAYLKILTTLRCSMAMIRIVQKSFYV